MIKLVEMLLLQPGEYQKVNILNEQDKTIVVEKTGEAKQEYTAKAVFTFPISRPNKENLNGRIYNEKLWKRTEKILKDSSTFGLMDHPEQEGSTKDIWCVWRNLRFSEDKQTVVADAYLIGEWGDMVKEILEAGGRVGLSTSGYGEFLEDNKTVNPDTFELERVADFVFNPSYEVYGTLGDKKEKIKESEMKINENKDVTVEIDHKVVFPESGEKGSTTATDIIDIEEKKKKSEEEPEEKDKEDDEVEEKKTKKKEEEPESKEDDEGEVEEKKTKKKEEEEPEDDEVEEKKSKKKEEEDSEDDEVEEKKKKKKEEEDPESDDDEEDEVEEKKKKKKEAADTSTFKCPDCGGKVLTNTEYCVSCKKKVKNKSKKEDDNKDDGEEKKDDKKKEESLLEKFFRQNMASLFKQAKEKETPEERVKAYEELIPYFEEDVAISLREEIEKAIEEDKAKIVVVEEETTEEVSEDVLTEKAELEEKYKNALELLDSMKVYAKKLKEMYELAQAERNGMVTATEYKEVQVYLEGVEHEKELLERELRDLKNRKLETIEKEAKEEKKDEEVKTILPEKINPEVQKYYDAQEYATPSIVIIKEDILRCRTLMEAQKTALRLKPLWDTVESAYDRKFVGQKDSFVESSHQKLPIKEGWM